MNLNEARTLATTAMTTHGLKGWTFKFNNQKSTMGLTKHYKRTIELSTLMTEHATREQVTATIGHEIAHALVGPGHGHGPVWKRQMLAMGLEPKRCGETNDDQQKVIVATAKYVMTCSVSGKMVGTLNRLVKTRTDRRGFTRTYTGHRCQCHRSSVLYNGKPWSEL